MKIKDLFDEVQALHMSLFYFESNNASGEVIQKSPPRKRGRSAKRVSDPFLEYAAENYPNVAVTKISEGQYLVNDKKV